MLVAETPMEFFKDRVDSALANQSVQAGETTRYYLVSLLNGFVRPQLRVRSREQPMDQPLGLQFVRALGAGGIIGREGLRLVGDTSLFLAGFFQDSLKRKLVDIDHYLSLGALAYAQLSLCERVVFAEQYSELAEKFGAFVDVINEISEDCRMSTSADIMRLYEKWLRGSERAGLRLASLGVAPNASIRGRFLQ